MKMERWQGIILGLSYIASAYLLVSVTEWLKLKSVIVVPLFLGMIAFWFLLTEAVRGWQRMGSLAINLADQVAFSEEISHGHEVQIATGVTRIFPPRQLFACAIGKPGYPIIMYRGMKLFITKPLDKPKDTRTGWLCWRYRP